MRFISRRMWAVALALAAHPPGARTQAQTDGATVSGRVTSTAGAPLASANVFLEGMSLGASTNDDGRYSFTVPAARLTNQPATLTVRLIGYRAQSVRVTLQPGAITQDFSLEPNPLRLGEVVVTGAGTSTETEKLGNVRNNVDSSLIERSNEPNIVQALAGKAPNVEVTESSGEPGAGSYIRIRGTRSLASGNSQPLFVVDGVPIDNSSTSTTNFNPVDGLNSGEIEGTAQANRAIDINPDDISNIEILKGAAASAIYGARAGQGVVLITTKRGHAGATRYSLRSSLSFDDITKRYPLQTAFGQGFGGESPETIAGSDAACDNIGNFNCRTSWGPDLQAAGTPTFDHAMEAYVTGHTTDNTLSISGGNDRTTFYLSAGYMYDRGIFEGPNNNFQRSSVRLKANQYLTDRLSVGGNFYFADTRGSYVERGNNTNGLQLGLLRTPPDYNNLPYLDPTTGLQRTFRFKHPQPNDISTDRGWANPFWVLNTGVHTAQVGRLIGNIDAQYQATDWLRLNYTLGADYSADERLEGAPQDGTGPEAGGRVEEGKIVTYALDHNLTATASHTFSPNFSGTLTLGQNLDARDYRQLSDVGRTLLAAEPLNLANTVNRDPTIDQIQEIRTEAYFGQATLDLYNQLYLTLAARNDGSSTFDRQNLRSWFPKASAAWTFTKLLGESDVLPYGKLRVAYGEAGQEPLPYLTSQTYTTASFTTIAQGVGLTPTQNGFGGLASSFQKASTTLIPERTREFETGFDVGLFKDRADASFTFYEARTDNVILTVPLAPSSGFLQQAQQGAKFRNRGVEVTLNVRPFTSANASWEVGVQWARNRSKVLQLLGSNFVNLDPQYITPFAVAMEGQPIGVFYDFGWARCGVSPNGLGAVIPGVDLAQVCAGAPRGALYIGADGFPVGDPNARVIGDPNPDWTGSVRSTVRLRKWQFSGLVDIKHGGVIYNGTKGALQAYGTHATTAQRATCDQNDNCTGNEKVFGQGGWYDGPVVGPGAGTAVPIGQNWYLDSPVLFFAGYSEPFMEPGGYVKLRELSVGYTFDAAWVQRTLGLTSLDVRVAGRNLWTSTKYTGYDPETNLSGAVGHTLGLDYFNQPQARSFVITLGLNR